MWHDHLKTKLLQECQVASRQKLILGFSGGPDSLALLHALHVLEQPLVAAHLDHGLRPESAIEAEQAGQEAAFLGVPFLSERKDVGTFAEENRLSVEEAARQLRYAFLFKVAERQGASAVAVAHTADDQVETVLMHLLRGAGMAGLRGMAPRLLPNPWSAEIPLVRPILGIWRLEVLEYCAAQGLQPVQDASNQDTIFFRNRMRQDLVPQLETLAPGFKRRLAQSASLVAADYEVLASLTEATWRRCLSQQAAEYLELSRPAFLVELLSLQRAVLRRAV
ncbi:MAG TPA: tRNA lysidine(34) synthetase TilS, partial [Anaerolineales bacterium]